MKRLYDENDRYTNPGLQLSNTTADVLEPILEKYISEGYSIRDIQNIMCSAVNEIALGALFNGKSDLEYVRTWTWSSENAHQESHFIGKSENRTGIVSKMDFDKHYYWEVWENEKQIGQGIDFELEHAEQAVENFKEKTSDVFWKRGHYTDVKNRPLNSPYPYYWIICTDDSLVKNIGFVVHENGKFEWSFAGEFFISKKGLETTLVEAQSKVMDLWNQK